MEAAPVVAIVAPGAMGAALGARLVENGLRVLTCLEGRGAESRARAASAGLEPVDEAGLMQADILLAVVPPAEATALARHLAPHLRAAARKPVYVDANAVGPETLAAVADLVAATGAPFLDGALIGLPPEPGARGPRFHLSGDDPEPVLRLARYGLDMRRCPGGIGAASSLKMSYAGLNKGLTALAAVMILAAERAGAGEALRAELAENEPQLLARFAKGLPDMLPKAWRWSPEMREIAAFLGPDAAGAQVFAGYAELYARLATPENAEEAARLRAFAEAAKA